MKIYNIVQNIFLGGLGIVIVILLVLFFIFNIRPSIVMSGSMEPGITIGSMCFIDNDVEDIKKGDVIVYENLTMEVIHRVIDVTPDGKYITKGDNNDVPDYAPVDKSQITGMYSFSIPKLGYVAAALRCPNGIIVVISFIIVFIITGKWLKRQYKE